MCYDFITHHICFVDKMQGLQCNRRADCVAVFFRKFFSRSDRISPRRVERHMANRVMLRCAINVILAAATDVSENTKFLIITKITKILSKTIM